MSTFDNVSLTKAANIYFDGKVTSRTITFADGSTKTLGVMLTGDYEFNTAAAELMEITAGNVDVQHKGEENWTNYTGGTSFDVPANTSFKIKVSETADYICTYK